MRSLLVAAALAAGACAAPAQSQQPAGPPIPYEDIGACPFECCTYREWTATAQVNGYTERSPSAAVAFVVASGDRVRALTGVVITTKPGVARVPKPIDLWTPSGPLHVVPADTLFLLTPHGEGHVTAWFKGRIYDQVDASMFTTINSVCDTRPERCAGRVTEKATTEWWVRIRNLKGVRGWTNEPEKFSKQGRLRLKPVRIVR